MMMSMMMILTAMQLVVVAVAAVVVIRNEEWGTWEWGMKDGKRGKGDAGRAMTTTTVLHFFCSCCRSLLAVAVVVVVVAVAVAAAASAAGCLQCILNPSQFCWENQASTTQWIGKTRGGREEFSCCVPEVPSEVVLWELFWGSRRDCPLGQKVERWFARVWPQFVLQEFDSLNFSENVLLHFVRSCRHHPPRTRNVFMPFIPAALKPKTN